MALARWQRTIVDNAGNILPGAQVTVRRETAGAPLAVLYSDRDGTVPLGNPFTADVGTGFAAFHVAGGAYRIDVVSGAFSQTLRYVAVGTAAENDSEAFVAESVAATGTPASRPVADHLADLFSLKAFGAVGDGAFASPPTDDTAAVQAADAEPGAKFVPEGIYDVTLSAGDLDGPYWGRGQIRDADENRRAPWFSAIKAAPASLGDHDSVSTAFNGDLSAVQIAMEHRVTGSATLGQPSTGYQADPECSPIYLNLFNSSGHNEELDGNDGRTAIRAVNLHLTNSGQGDCVGFHVTGVVSGEKASSTSFLANPAVTVIDSALFAGSDGVLLNTGEMQLHDNGFDVAAIGWNIILDRNDATGAKEAFWAAFRAHSNGAASADMAFQAVGLFDYGLDLTGCTFAANGAIALAANQRIYGNAVADASGALGAPSSSGDEWLAFNSSLGAWEFYVNNSVQLLVADGSATFVGGVRASHPTAGIGYATGAGGTVTQLTSKSTGVTLNKVVGKVTMNNAALGAGGIVGFQLSNSAIGADDLVHAQHVSGGTAGAYRISVDAVAAGSCAIRVTNVSGGSLGEAIVIGFIVFKGANS